VYKQQLSGMLEGNYERRYFDGVKGVKGKEGELFGLLNLIQFSADSFTNGT
jgi:hypothetical protein